MMTTPDRKLAVAVFDHFGLFGILAVALAMSGCANFMYKQHSSVRGEIVKKKDVDCTTPFELSFGCKGKTLANIPFNLHGLEFKAAATADGSTTLVVFGKLTGGTTVLTNLVFDAVRTEFSQNGLPVRSVVAIQDHYYEGANVIVGYYVSVDGNGFELLRKYQSRDQEQ